MEAATDIDSEWIERAALMELHAGVNDAVRSALDLIGRQIDGVFVSCAARLPASAVAINRAVGLGHAHPATWAELDGVLSLYRDEGIERFLVQVGAHAQPEELPTWLESAGLEESRAWQKFARGAEPAPEVRSDLTVRQIGLEHAGEFGLIVARAFDLGEGGADLLAALPGQPCWRVFMTFDGDTPAGAGAMFIKDGAAWFDWGATAPQFRQRGGQSVLLAARIEAARALGVTRMFTYTDIDLPTDPQHAFANIKRAGFEETEVRANWAPKRG